MSGVRDFDEMLRPIDCYTGGEVARMAGVSRQLVDYCRERGHLASFAVEGRRWYRDDDVAEWMRERSRRA
jgi:DNA-binding transcriptional MerR regulator